MIDYEQLCSVCNETFYANHSEIKLINGKWVWICKDCTCGLDDLLEDNK